MQAVVHQMPSQMLPQYPRQSLNGLVNHHAVPPTPPVSSRKRKRPHQFTVSYSEVQEIDSEGKLREVIVIDDSPPPPTISPATTYTNGYSASYQPPQYSAPIRTRARAAAEAQALSGSSSAVAIVAPAPKKRKREPADDSRTTLTKKTVSGTLLQQQQQQQQTTVINKSTASGSGAAADDVGILFYNSVNSDHDESIDTCRAPYLAMTKKGIILLFLMILSRGAVSQIVDGIFNYNNWRLSDCTVRLLGQGTFGKVVEAIDTQTNNRVAIKIIRAIPKYRDASKIEVRVLQKLKERDPMNRQ